MYIHDYPCMEPDSVLRGISPIPVTGQIQSLYTHGNISFLHVTVSYHGISAVFFNDLCKLQILVIFSSLTDLYVIYTLVYYVRENQEVL